MNEFVPYGDPAGTDIGDLTIETDADAVKVFGSISLLRDEQGLEDVRRMIRILQATERIIESTMGDPRRNEVAEQSRRRGPNPFDFTGRT